MWRGKPKTVWLWAGGNVARYKNNPGFFGYSRRLDYVRLVLVQTKGYRRIRTNRGDGWVLELDNKVRLSPSKYGNWWMDQGF